MINWNNYTKYIDNAVHKIKNHESDYDRRDLIDKFARDSHWVTHYDSAWDLMTAMRQFKPELIADAMEQITDQDLSRLLDEYVDPLNELISRHAFYIIKNDLKLKLHDLVEVNA